MTLPEWPEKEIKSIKDVRESMEKITSDGKIDAKELVELKKSTDFLENIQNNKNIQGESDEKTKWEVEKISNTYKPKITEWIIMQLGGKINLSSKPGDMVSANKWIEITNIVTGDVAKAYINIINWINKDPLVQTEKTPDQIKKDQEQKTILNKIKTKLEVHNEKLNVVDGEKYLFDLLSSTPSIENAKNLFWDNGKWENNKREKTWEALKKNTNNNKFEINKESKIDNTKNLSKEQLERNFEKLVSIYAEKSDTKTTNIQVLTNTKGKLYIKVWYEDKTYKDIMFGDDPNIIHEARASELTQEQLTEYATKFKNNMKETIQNDSKESMDKNGAHRTLKILLDKGLVNFDDIFKNKDNNILQEIDKKNWQEDEVKNWYYTVINDYVVGKADKWKWNIIMLKRYLEVVNKDNIKYLGTETKTQINNYNKLAQTVTETDANGITKTRSEFNDPVTGKEILDTIRWLQDQFKEQSPQNIQDIIKQSWEKFRNQYGDIIVEILEFFGGKGFAKNLLGKYYGEYETRINEKYAKKYSLSKEQKDAVKELTKNIKNDKKLFEEASKRPSAEEFKEKFDTINKKDSFTKNITNEQFKHMDTKVMSKAIATHNKKYEGDKAEQIDPKDYFVTNSKWWLELNTNIQADQQKKMVNMIIDDDTTRKSITTANKKIMWEATKNVLGETSKDLSRNDLETNERYKYSINTPKDLSIALTSYLFAGSKELDYVITETKFSEDPRAGKVNTVNTGSSTPPETTKTEVKFNEKLATLEGVITEEWAKKSIDEIIDMTNPPEKIKITKADGKTTTEATLKKDFWKEKKTTYIVMTKDNKEEKVTVGIWDKIEPVQKVETAKPADKATDKPAVATSSKPVETKK